MSKISKFVNTVWIDFLKAGGVESTLLDSVKLVDAQKGKVQLSMEIQSKQLNRLGQLHGGTIASLVDIGGSLSVASHGLFATGVSTDLNVSYLRTGGSTGNTIHIPPNTPFNNNNIQQVAFLFQSFLLSTTLLVDHTCGFSKPLRLSKISSPDKSHPTTVIPSYSKSLESQDLSPSSDQYTSNDIREESPDTESIPSLSDKENEEPIIDQRSVIESQSCFKQQYDTPPPPYTPAITNLYSMSLNQGSIITQANSSEMTENVGLLARSLEGSPYDSIELNLRDQKFDLSRQELLRLPESILLGISNGLEYDPSENGTAGLANATAAKVNFSPACFAYTLNVFNKAAEECPEDSDGEAAPTPTGTDYNQGNLSNIGEVLRKYPAIILLREDLDYYCLPNKDDITVEEMHELKKKCGEILLKNDGIFPGLRKGDKADSPEQHLIEMLCSCGFTLNDKWGIRENEPNKTVVTSLALVRLPADKEDNETEAETNGVAEQGEQDLLTTHKLLLFWRKPARKCWWESLEFKDVEGVEGTVRVHVRRVWTLELSVIDGKSPGW